MRVSGLFYLFNWVLAYLLVKSGNQRNLLFIPMLSIMMLLDLSILISAKSGEIMLAKHLMNTAVLVFTMLITLLGGRVIPFFTRKGLNCLLYTSPSPRDS